ncbi:hypothetical protein P3T76_015377 [Phytophthora citrophthora]|uniref:Uncharacterized protein n=1 Tax=Phytophthora citrophthora TaxID=4793 RepID=A0AAD9FZC4_9STRA|nr:hypothetical protein P3T76_015377 [Phytophthora citrophthora]
MTKSASRQKTNTSTGDAPSKPSGKANAAQAVKAEVPAAPTREVSPGKSTKANAKNVNAKNSTQTISLTELTPANVQRAREIRKTDCDHFQKFHNFYMANDTATASVINSKTNVKQEQVTQWLRGVVNPKTLASIEEIQETPSALLALLIVSAALNKYGEQELARRDGLGEMDYVVGSRFGTNGLRSKQHAPHNVGVNFLLQLVLGLAPEKRATCEVLREILIHEEHDRLALTPSNKGLQSESEAVASDSDDWAVLKQDQLRQMAKQAQSDKFQETMQQLGGEHLYNAVRMQLKQVGGASVWEAKKDKPALQAKNLRPRSGSADKNVKSQKNNGGQKQQQTAKKNGLQVKSVKKNLPVEIEKFALLPPPAPVIAKSATAKKEAVPTKKESAPIKKEAVPTKKESAPIKKEAASVKKEAVPTKKDGAPKDKGQQAKNPASEKNGKNGTPGKNAAPVKNVTAGAIVNNARDGRATVSKAK